MGKMSLAKQYEGSDYDLPAVPAPRAPKRLHVSPRGMRAIEVLEDSAAADLAEEMLVRVKQEFSRQTIAAMGVGSARDEMVAAYAFRDLRDRGWATDDEMGEIADRIVGHYARLTHDGMQASFVAARDRIGQLSEEPLEREAPRSRWDRLLGR